MKHAAICVFVMIQVASPGRADAESKLSAEYIRVKSGVLRIKIDSPIVYLPAKGDSYHANFLQHSFKEFGSSEVQNEKGGFYKVAGKPSEIELTCKTPEICKIKPADKIGLFYTFSGEGEAVFSLKFDGVETDLPITVSRLPFALGDASKEAIKSFGFPDKEQKNFVSWPKTQTIHSIIYSPTATESSISSIHWQWKTHPNLVVSIVDSKVYKIGSFIDQDYNGWKNEFDVWNKLIPEKEPKPTPKAKVPASKPNPPKSAEKVVNKKPGITPAELADGKLKMAKPLKNVNMKAYKQRLQEIINKYPDTEAAKEAAELLE